MKLTLDPGAAALLNALHAAGYAAYAVGGCVRDSLLGRTAHDWDLCTSALPQQVMELFGAAQCIPTGLQHGTVVRIHRGAFAHAAAVVRAGRTNFVYPGCKAHRGFGLHRLQHLRHVLFKTAAVALAHKIGHAKPVVSAQGQHFFFIPHICAGAR